MKLKDRYKGVIVPMVSPFKVDFSVDEKAVATIINSFVQNDIKPFVLGTTGEASSFSLGQKIDLINYSVKALNGKQPLLAGIGSNSIFTSIEEGKQFVDMGVDALVATVPNYYPSGDVQMIKWFEKLADNVSAPLFIYNIPVTTHHSIPLDVVEILSEHPNIVGVKDSERGEERLLESLERWKDREDFMFLVGWAAMSSFGLKNGANGIVPSMGNLIPKLFSELVIEAEKGNYERANELQKQTDKIALYCQKGRNISQAVPAMKVLMSMKNICSPQVLPPMLRMEKNEELEYIKVMREALENI